VLCPKRHPVPIHLQIEQQCSRHVCYGI
jgi:hypothetical protein